MQEFAKPRNVLVEGDYQQEEADSPEELLEKLLGIKHRAWFELYKVEIMRKVDIPTMYQKRRKKQAKKTLLFLRDQVYSDKKAS